jgi:cytoskeletal protein CcmA (bactofilin family)
MFGNEKGRAPKPSGALMETLIGPHVVIRGDVHFSGGLYIEGKVHGAVIAEDDSEAVLTVSEQGLIEGEVRAPVVVVNGQLNGDVYARERIELASNARVQGNIYYRVVEMAAGAMISGRLIHGEAPPKQLSGPKAVADAKVDKKVDAVAEAS